MKRIFAVIFLLAIGFTGTVYASHSSHGDIGLGIQLGEPSGLTGKFWIGGNNAIDATIGWNLISDWFILQAGYLYNFPLPVTTGALGVYVGVGGIVGGFAGTDVHDGSLYIAARIPVGLEYIYSPISFYGEIDPLVSLIPATDFGLGGGLGFRFYF